MQRVLFSCLIHFLERLKRIHHATSCKKKNTYIMKYILITHCAGCLWCVVRRGHARPSKWHTVTSSSWQTNFDYWCVITSRRGVRHSPDFHETAVHKVLANLICPSRYFQKQPVSPSAKQWERPQDNKISPGRAWWGGPEEGATGGMYVWWPH